MFGAVVDAAFPPLSLMAFALHPAANNKLSARSIFWCVFLLWLTFLFKSFLTAVSLYTPPPPTLSPHCRRIIL